MNNGSILSRNRVALLHTGSTADYAVLPTPASHTQPRLPRETEPNPKSSNTQPVNPPTQQGSQQSSVFSPPNVSRSKSGRVIKIT